MTEEEYARVGATVNKLMSALEARGWLERYVESDLGEGMRWTAEGRIRAGHLREIFDDLAGPELENCVLHLIQLIRRDPSFTPAG